MSLLFRPAELWAEAALLCGVTVMWRYVVIGCCGLGWPAMAQAEDAPLVFGTPIASDYVAGGIRYSDGTGAHTFMELGLAHFMPEPMPGAPVW